jgi:hypothetical protein
MTNIKKVMLQNLTKAKAAGDSYLEQLEIAQQAPFEDKLPPLYEARTLNGLHVLYLQAARDPNIPCGSEYDTECFSDPTPLDYFSSGSIVNPAYQLDTGRRKVLAWASVKLLQNYAVLDRVGQFSPVEELAFIINGLEHSQVADVNAQVYLYDLVLYALLGQPNTVLGQFQPTQNQPRSDAEIDEINAYLELTNALEFDSDGLAELLIDQNQLGQTGPQEMTPLERAFLEQLAGWSVILWRVQGNNAVRDETFLNNNLLSGLIVDGDQVRRNVSGATNYVLNNYVDHATDTYVLGLFNGNQSYSVGGQTINFNPNAIRTFAGSEFAVGAPAVEYAWFQNYYAQNRSVSFTYQDEQNVTQTSSIGLYAHRFEGGTGLYVMQPWQQNFARQLASGTYLSTVGQIQSEENLLEALCRSGLVNFDPLTSYCEQHGIT